MYKHDEKQENLTTYRPLYRAVYTMKAAMKVMVKSSYRPLYRAVYVIIL